MDSPTSTTSSDSVKSIKHIVKSFSNPIADKLDEDSFLPWQQLALASIHGHNLQKHLNKDKVPVQYTTAEDQIQEKETEEYINWHQQDNLLVSWLLSSMNISFKNRMVGCKFSHEIWTRLQVYFASHTQAKVKQLKNQLKTIKKTGPASDYLLQIKKVIDSLRAVGSPMTDAEHSEAILDGLSEEYTPLITSAMSRSPPFSIIELEAFLLAQEDMLERFKKPDQFPVQANFIQRNYSQDSNGPRTFGRRGRGGRSTFRGDRYQSWNSNRLQCQICGRGGHPASRCFHRYDSNFQNNNSTIHDLGNLSSSSSYNGSEQVQIGNGTGHKWNRKRKLIITSAAIGGLLICVAIFYLRYKSSTWLGDFGLTAKSNQHIEAFLKNHGAQTLKRYKLSDIKKMTNGFEIKLGQGGFGAVYKGKLPNGCPIAVKMLKASKGNGEEFINEVASISKTSHVNVVTLLGFCLEGPKKALIYEFMSNGSLDKFIYRKGPYTATPLSWDILHQIAMGIARGLEYLHRGCNTRILHFDIKPHNILLDENFCPKISDFGLAKLCPKKESIISMSDARGTMGYVAPEVLNRHFARASHKSDVYSYGMMMLEMVGGRRNVNAEASHTSEIYFPHWVYKRLELGNELKLDEVMTSEENEIAKRLTVLGLWCIQTFPNDRPTMSRVIDMLDGSKNSLEMPPKPLLSPTRSVVESSIS